MRPARWPPCMKPGVPIWIQAYPDEYDKMGPALRRDSFCGKISIMDVFRQYGVKFTALKPHTVQPGSQRFKANVDEFDRICRVVGGVKGMVVGAIGARTTPFKTVRIDEVTLQRHGVTVETFDLSDIFLRMKAVKPEEAAYADKAKALRDFTLMGRRTGSGVRQPRAAGRHTGSNWPKKPGSTPWQSAAGPKCSSKWAFPPAW